jgi:hypothetical protein
MAKFEWKKGDVLMCIDESDYPVAKGTICIADNDISNDNPEYSGANVKLPNGNVNNYYLKRFVKVEGKVESKPLGRPVVPKSLVKHVIVQDSCGNFCKFANSFEEASELAKKYNLENLTIYEMKEVAKVSTERKVSKIVDKKPVTPLIKKQKSNYKPTGRPTGRPKKILASTIQPTAEQLVA